MTPTPEMIALAERVAKNWPTAQGAAYNAALTVIMEVSEKVAHHLFTLGEFEASEAIRNGEHLR